MNFQENLERLIKAWESFHSNLPNGEYKGLGEMRAAVYCIKKIPPQHTQNEGQRRVSLVEGAVSPGSDICLCGHLPEEHALGYSCWKCECRKYRIGRSNPVDGVHTTATTQGASTTAWACEVHNGSVGANYPQDCDWPTCGCDPYATKVIEALQEGGWHTAQGSATGENAPDGKL